MIQIIMESYSDLINHFYFLVIDVWELHPQFKQKMCKTRFINC